MTRYLDSILDAVGGTPLVRLGRIGEGLPATILAKVESCNPGGSSKDRIAVAMVDDAERRGTLGPGGTIVEATAGNTGVGLAMVAARDRLGISGGLVRLSVGIEDVADLLEDLRSALAAARAGPT